jgi:hypothetical protein
MPPRESSLPHETRKGRARKVRSNGDVSGSPGALGTQGQIATLRDLLQSFAWAARLEDGKRLKEIGREIEESYIYARDNAWSDGYRTGQKL